MRSSSLPPYVDGSRRVLFRARSPDASPNRAVLDPVIATRSIDGVELELHSPFWLHALSHKEQLRLCPFHPLAGRSVFESRRVACCKRCSALLPVREVLVISACCHPMTLKWLHALPMHQSYPLTIHVLQWLTRGDLAKLLQATRADAYSQLQLQAYCEYLDEEWCHDFEAQRFMMTTTTPQDDNNDDDAATPSSS